MRTLTTTSMMKISSCAVGDCIAAVTANYVRTWLGNTVDCGEHSFSFG
jgi:hypothetical protein